MSLQQSIWSTQQQEIFKWFESGRGNAVVVARAGCGKTTTIIEGVKRAPESDVLIAAFAKPIQEELNKRIGKGFEGKEARTLHSVGYECIRNFRDRIRPEFKGTDRADKLAQKACGKVAPDTIVRLVSKLCTKGREIAPHAAKLGDLTAIAITFECEPDESWARAGYGLDYVEARALEAMEFATEIKSGDVIDGSDMIFLPIRMGWMIPKWNLIVVDEAQDMTPAQLEIAQGMLLSGGRICIVGDDRQAIFGFRGADSGCLDRLKTELNAVEFGLKKTYRCGKSIVNLAQSIVPDFEADENNSDGDVLSIPSSALTQAAGPNDFILSRVNAPLVSIALQLLRSGKRAKVAGKDIGQGLQALIRKFKAASVPDLIRKISAWENKEVSRLESRLNGTTNGKKAAVFAKIETIHDQAEMLISLTDGAKNVNEVNTKIEYLFSKEKEVLEGVIICSSVHKAKGLEAERVFILRDTLRYGHIEEENIAYVAVTRAKKSLVWVSDKEVV